jgi:hypothetical protein
MRKIKTITLFTLILLVSSCSKKIIPTSMLVIPTAEVTYLSSKNGVLNLSSIGYCPLSDKKSECADSSQVNAFRTLFNRGIPGSSQNTPLISYEERSTENYNKYMNDFFSSGNYKSFIVSSEIASEISEQNWYKTTVNIGINLSSLRQELEQKKVIRKFGY